MAYEQYFSQEWKRIPATATSDNLNGCFDCNICLDIAHEPIVTPCGHLYCWPCIYEWLHVQSASLASNEAPQCPVCKADISHTTMIPLYGRGQPEPEFQSKAPNGGRFVPPRPSARGNHNQTFLSNPSPNSQQLAYRNSYQNQNEGNSAPSSANLGVNGIQHSVSGLFGGMVYASVFGNPEGVYAYPNSYYLIRGSSNSRLRRHEMQAEKSLNKISIFLLCCFLLCVIVF